eukprot:TRINITY_DN2212_c0_g1_i2.p1 TRINITY_DN2212_c0_g1~~TRINITY_DN2212_c0_g1_i2.p1  ORF type:complete len:426 (+),score=62.76 TRINITY_DN2212_c0_g1_i2:154-1431(+)
MGNRIKHNSRVMAAPDEKYGYPKERFPTLSGESFDCIICLHVVRDPKECHGCGSMFCSSCIDDWQKKSKECPNRCDIAKTQIKPISRALYKIYSDLDIKCKYPSCGKNVKLADLAAHEAKCQLPKCLNFDVCSNLVKPEYKDKGVCDLSCALLTKIRNLGHNDWAAVLLEIKNFKNEILKNAPPVAVGNVPRPLMSVPGSVAGVTNFRWDAANIGTGIEVSANKQHIFLKESAYMFRTAISDTGMMSGQHYWEIVADANTENELKIGVATKKDFNYNSAFCDYEFGFAYYGLGQLRHNSNASGPQYGERFKKTGVLGVFLNMDNGTLSFALDGKYFGVAFTSDQLRTGPIYASVSLLHCAGCRLDNGKPAPTYFLKQPRRPGVIISVDLFSFHSIAIDDPFELCCCSMLQYVYVCVQLTLRPACL